VPSFGFRVSGLGFQVSGTRFRVSGFENPVVESVPSSALRFRVRKKKGCKGLWGCKPVYSHCGHPTRGRIPCRMTGVTLHGIISPEGPGFWHPVAAILPFVGWFRVSSFGFRVQMRKRCELPGLGLKEQNVSTFGCPISGFGFRVPGGGELALSEVVAGFGFRVPSTRSRVSGFGHAERTADTGILVD